MLNSMIQSMHLHCNPKMLLWTISRWLSPFLATVVSHSVPYVRSTKIDTVTLIVQQISPCGLPFKYCFWSYHLCIIKTSQQSVNETAWQKRIEPISHFIVVESLFKCYLLVSCMSCFRSPSLSTFSYVFKIGVLLHLEHVKDLCCAHGSKACQTKVTAEMETETLTEEYCET